MKKLVLNTCYHCPHSFIVWEPQGDEDEYLLRYGCQHKAMKVVGVKERNGRLIALAETMGERPEIPIWCPLEDV